MAKRSAEIEVKPSPLRIELPPDTRLSIRAVEPPLYLCTSQPVCTGRILYKAHPVVNDTMPHDTMTAGGRRPLHTERSRSKISTKRIPWREYVPQPRCSNFGVPDREPAAPSRLFRPGGDRNAHRQHHGLFRRFRPERFR